MTKTEKKEVLDVEVLDVVVAPKLKDIKYKITSEVSGEIVDHARKL